MKAYKTELDPNDKQITAMRQHVGAARWAYNWGLDQIKKAASVKGDKWPSAIDLHKRLNALKGTAALPWGYEVSKCAFQEALRNLQAAVSNWNSSRKGKRKGAKMGFPKPKTRKKGLGSCRFTGTITIFEGMIQLPRIGLIRLKEFGFLPVGYRVAQAVISEQAGHWFVSVTTKEESEKPELTANVIGIDVGIKTLAVTSDGDMFANPKALAAKTKQLRRWQRRLSRRVKGSQNRMKARIKVARLHKKVGDIRRDAHNKAARTIVNKLPSVIVLENLNVKGMFKNRKLSRALGDAALSQFGRILTYMAEDFGIHVVHAGRFFASSKLCSSCRWKHEELTVADRTFVCQCCGLIIDRDLNAAYNLKNTVSSTGIYACGDRVSPRTSNSGVEAVIVEAGTLSPMSADRMFV